MKIHKTQLQKSGTQLAGLLNHSFFRLMIRLVHAFLAEFSAPPWKTDIQKFKAASSLKQRDITFPTYICLEMIVHYISRHYQTIACYVSITNLTIGTPWNGPSNPVMVRLMPHFIRILKREGTVLKKRGSVFFICQSLFKDPITNKHLLQSNYCY